MEDSRVDMTLSCTVWERGRGRERAREENQVQQPGDPKAQRRWVTQKVQLYRKEQLSPLGWSLG